MRSLETRKPNEALQFECPDGVLIRTLTIDDAQAYFDLIEFDRAHLSQNGDVTAQKYGTVADVEASFLDPKPCRYRFAIEHNGLVVGSNNLEIRPDNSAELGSWVGAECIGNGFAGKAREGLLVFAFDVLQLDKVYCEVSDTNRASQRSMEKTGMTLLGVEGHHNIYGMTNQQYRQRSSDGR